MLQIPHRIRAGKAAEVPHRIDQADGSRGSAFGENGRGQRPEDGRESPEEARSHGQQQDGSDEMRARGNTCPQRAACNQQGHRRVPAPLIATIRGPARQDHREQQQDIRRRRDQCDGQVGQTGELFQDGRQPEGNAVASGYSQEVNHRQQHHVAVAQRLPNSELSAGIFLTLLALQLRDDPIALVGWQPVGLLRPVGKIKDRNDTKYNCGHAFQKKDPSPARQPRPVNAQDEAR